MFSHSKLTLTRMLAMTPLLLAAGCASMRGPNSTESFGASANTESFASRIGSATKGIGGQFKSMGTAVSSAYSKTKQAVSNTFTPGSSDKGDPTSLSNMPSPSSLGPEIWVTNGQLYESQGQFAKALDNYTKALELEPNNEAALVSTARLYSRQKQHTQASEFFSKALAISPKADTYSEYGSALAEAGNEAEAQVALRKAIEIAPANAKYRNNLANILVKNGKSNEALQVLQQGGFQPAAANYNVAYLNYQNQNVAAAQQHLQVALQHDPNLELAKNLMNKISGSPTTQTAMAAYNSAKSIYRTAEAVVQPQVSANQAFINCQPLQESWLSRNPTARLQTNAVLHLLLARKFQTPLGQAMVQ